MYIYTVNNSEKLPDKVNWEMCPQGRNDFRYAVGLFAVQWTLHSICYSQHEREAATKAFQNSWRLHQNAVPHHFHFHRPS